MKKNKNKTKNLFKRMSGWLRGFLILALAFLAVGLGTLGSTTSTGKGYVLPAQKDTDDKQPCILLSVTLPEELSGKDATTFCFTSVYFNLGAIYAESGKPGAIRLSRGSTESSSFYNYNDVYFENFYAESASEEESSSNIVLQKDALYNWVEFKFAKPEEMVFSSYRYWKLTIPGDKGTGCDVLINEIAFVVQEKDADNQLLPERYALNASVIFKDDLSRTLLPPASGETYQQAAERANAIVDSPCVPSSAQSSFNRYTQEEIYTLMTINEMRQGDNLASGIYRYQHDGKTYYHADTVYNSLGTDLVALGVGMFGMSPFGLRFMPFLASFGVLVFGYLFVRKLAGSDKAGFIFALLYTLCGAGFSLGHLGTPLMIGLCFFTAALYFTFRFFKDGMKKPNFLSAVPALCGGLFGAAAICVNGAFVIPTVFLVGLFAAGVVRQYRKTRAALDAAIDEVEAYESVPHPEDGEKVSEPRKKLGAALNAHRIGVALPCAVFFALLVIGTFLISMLSYLPLHQTYVRLYDDPLSPTKNVFYFMWRAFAGGFIGENFLASSQSVWNFFYVLFRGTGEVAAITATGSLVAIAALVAGIAGVVLALIRLARSTEGTEEGRPSFTSELAVTLTLMLGFVLSLVTAFIAKGGLAFMLLAYLFLFAFAARSASVKEEGKLGTAVKVLSWVCLAALIVVFAVFAVVTFSIPTTGFLWGLAA